MIDRPTGPLQGVRILDVSHAAAGPYAAMLLADMGAEVIKVEPPAGEFTRFSRPHLDDGSGPYGGRYSARNRNKKSIALDLADDDDRQVYLGLVATADALIENMRSGVMDRLGVGWEVVHEHNPRLVYVAIRGFGDPRTGASPYADWPAFDIIAQAMGGLVSMTGQDPEHPLRAGPLVGDIFPAAMAALGLVSAVLHARQTGEGQFVDVAMVDAVMALCSTAQTMWDYEGLRYEPSGNSSADVTPFDVYETADGHCAVAAPTAAHWQPLCEIMDRPDLLADPRLTDLTTRAAYRDVVDSAVADWAREHTTAELVSLLGGRVPVGPVLTAQDWAVDPHVAARQMLVEVRHPHHRPTIEVACPIKFSATPTGVHAAPPVLDQHGAELRAEVSPPHPPNRC
jgi:crotonobetainyl-CoA:carnitine CoA-transferase CaiB-like acyl-CoA transferase